MRIFERMAKTGHEQLIFCCQGPSGLRMVIGIHDTTMGPAIGGTRMYPYATEDEVIEDVLRLSHGMTSKSAASGSDFGGGKAVVWGDPDTGKDEVLFRALGRHVESLQGRFITGTDVGTTAQDLVWAARETRFLVALPEEHGGSGDSSITTAFGVWKGIKACIQDLTGHAGLDGRTVAVQGLGKVGAKLVGYLCQEGARVTVTDTDPERVREVVAEHTVEVCPPEAIYDVPCDVFSPCALGGILNDETIPRLRCRAVSGGANNQLAEDRHGDLLYKMGVLYAPDFVVNAGGLIQVSEEFPEFRRERALARTAAIYDRLLAIFAISRDEGIPTHRAADLMVQRRLAALAGLGRIHVPSPKGPATR